MKFLELTNSQLHVMIDDEDFDRLSLFSWHVASKGKTIVRTENFFGGYKKQIVKTLNITNEIMRRFDTIFDHKDRNPFNSQKENLRECTTGQNALNKSKAKGKSSSYKGVSWSGAHKKWKVSIMFRNKYIYLGLFINEIDAAKEYDKAANELFKEFANLNFK